MTGGYMVVMTNRRWKPEQFHSAMGFLVKFFEMIPEFVWREYREKAGM